MPKALPQSFDITSKDKRRSASYTLAIDDVAVPEGVRGTHRGPIYRLERQVRTRRGFGTIIHTLTTFTSQKAKAHKMAVQWTKIKTRTR